MPPRERAAECRDVGRRPQLSADEPAQARGRHLDRRCRSIGEDVVRKAGEHGGPASPARDHEATAAGKPTAHRGQLAFRELTVDVLPHEAVDGAPRLHAIGQVGGRQQDDRRRLAARRGHQVELRDDPLGLLGDDADDHLGRIVNDECHGLRDDNVAVRHEAYVDGPPEGRWLHEQHIVLGGVGRQVDRRSELGPALRAAREAELADDRRPVIPEVDPEGHPRADPGVALEHRRRFHHRPVDRGRRHGTDWAEGDQQRSDQRPEKRAHADGAGRHRQGSGGNPSGRHGTGATEQGHS